jgi:hypothetical protein
MPTTPAPTSPSTTPPSTQDTVDTAPPRPEEDVLLTLPDAWRTDEVPDPFPSHQPGRIHCDPFGIGMEGDALEIDTGRCNYALAWQPLVTDLRPGDRVSVLASHGPLLALTEATGHISLAAGDVVLWEAEVPIPSEAGIYTPTVEVTAPVDAGTPLVLHCHNHGTNTWRLHDATLLAQETP